jgi:hypothetical protein
MPNVQQRTLSFFVIDSLYQTGYSAATPKGVQANDL